jgi:hypothetical protein
MNKRLFFLAPVLFFMSACSEVTAPALDVLDAIDDEIVAQFAEEVAEADEIRLPRLGALLRASREAIKASDGGHEEAIRFFRQARRLAVASEDSADAGAEEAAERLARASYRRTLMGIVATLGDAAAADALAGSAAGLARINDRLADRDVPARITAYLGRIGETITSGEAKLNEGESVAALHHALAAAEAIRHLSPSYLARKWIGDATQLFRTARAEVGDTPTEEEAKALRQAARLLRGAHEAYGAEEFGRAVNRATRAAALAGGVLQGRG